MYDVVKPTKNVVGFKNVAFQQKNPIFLSRTLVTVESITKVLKNSRQIFLRALVIVFFF